MTSLMPSWAHRLNKIIEALLEAREGALTEAAEEGRITQERADRIHAH